MTTISAEQLYGCLLGGAVGDTLGLPAEGIGGKRIRRLWKGEWRQRLCFGRGMFSDDTEHAMATAAALIEHRNNEELFVRSLARKLRWWFAALPAGTGMATAKAIIRLWIGVSPNKSGVCSAGNGPTMRSAIIGLVFADEAETRRAFTRAACCLTHKDPRAIEAAILTAEASACAAHGIDNEAVVRLLELEITSDEMKSRWEQLKICLNNNLPVEEFASAIGCANYVSGFAPNTVAVVLYAWLRHRGDFKTAMEAVLNCGGDVDTLGAVLGGIIGIECGEENITEWPRPVSYLRKLSEAFAGNCAPRYSWWGVPLRNLFFLIVVLCHVIRRLLPPY